MKCIALAVAAMSASCVQFSNVEWDGALPAPPADRAPTPIRVEIEQSFVRLPGSPPERAFDTSLVFLGQLGDTGYVRGAEPGETAALTLRGKVTTHFAEPHRWSYLGGLTLAVIPVWGTNEEVLRLDVGTSDGRSIQFEVTGGTTTIAWVPLIVFTPFFAERLVQHHHGELPAAVVGRLLEEGLLR